MKKTILLLLSIFALSACGSSNADAEPTEKLGHGDNEVTDTEISTNVVMLEKFIEKVDKLDNFKSKVTEAEVTEDSDIYVDEEGKEYANVYDVDLDITWQDKIYTVFAKIAWETDEPGGSANLLFYSSSYGGFHELPIEVK